MLNMGFIEQVEVDYQKVTTQRMTCIFSATLPDASEKSIA